MIRTWNLIYVRIRITFLIFDLDKFGHSIADITPPKNILDKNTCLVENHCVPMALLHFGTNESCDSTNLLRDEFLAKMSTHKAAIWAASKSRYLISHFNFS